MSTHSSTQRQHRGSSLLLAGRLLAKVVNFAVQIAIIRLLTKDDFGAFAYGLALVGAGELLVKLGIGQGSNRFVPYFYERGEHHFVLGTLALVTSMIISLGLVAFFTVLWISGQGWQGFPSGSGASVVVILTLLAPIQALDAVCIQTLACFAKPKQILLRKHVVGPVLRIVAVAAAFAAGGSSEVLVWAYLIGGLLGLVICLHLVVRELYRHKVLPMPPSRWRVPWQQLLGYSVPLISSDFVTITLTGVTTILLMYTGGESATAEMRSVAPAAALNMLVLQSFVIMFLPHATRLFARNQKDELNQHHWESAAWVAVLSFPIFALTFSIAPELVVLLFGQAYASSAIILAVLSLGTYAGVAMAFNTEALLVANQTKALIWSNLIMIFTSVALALYLCPQYGALGAALAVTIARVLGVTMRQVALIKLGCVGSTPGFIRKMWLNLAAATILTAIVGWVWHPPLIAQLTILGLGCLWLLRSCAHSLDIQNTFPEMLRVPILRRLVAV
jgi:O-antigen/teichoic acid export membrane protein